MSKTNQNTSLPVMEAFYTIQGEGRFQGKAAYFVRLSGCDVGCSWCDVKESWEKSSDQYQSIPTIVQEIEKTSAEIVVITGGEPLMYDLTELTDALSRKNLKTNLETSGAYPLTGIWNWICLSPKKFKVPTEDNYAHADELKIIVYNKSDFKWAEEQRKKVSEKCRLYLQPEWSKSKEMLPRIIDYVKNNPDWEISLQIHKFMDIP